MPWTPKQNKLFRAAEHNAAFAKKVGIKQSDAKRMAHEGIKKAAKGGIIEEATKAQARRLATVDDVEGSEVQKLSNPPESPKDEMVESTKRNTFGRAIGDRIRRGLGMKQSYKKGGSVKKKRTYYASCGGSVKKHSSGGRVDVNDPNEAKEVPTKFGEHKWQEKGKTKAKHFKDGGKVSSSKGSNIPHVKSNLDPVEGPVGSDKSVLHKKDSPGSKSTSLVEKMSTGGRVGGRGDGIASKGHTKGRCC